MKLNMERIESVISTLGYIGWLLFLLGIVLETRFPGVMLVLWLAGAVLCTPVFIFGTIELAKALIGEGRLAFGGRLQKK